MFERKCWDIEVFVRDKLSYKDIISVRIFTVPWSSRLQTQRLSAHSITVRYMLHIYDHSIQLQSFSSASTSYQVSCCSLCLCGDNVLEERVAICTLRITTNTHQKTRIFESFPLIIKLSPKRARFRVVLVDVGENLFRKWQISNSQWQFSLPRLALKRKRLLSCNPIEHLALIFRHIICMGTYALLKIATNPRL